VVVCTALFTVPETAHEARLIIRNYGLDEDELAIAGVAELHL
jgi:hypothetical protein